MSKKIVISKEEKLSLEKGAHEENIKNCLKQLN